MNTTPHFQLSFCSRALLLLSSVLVLGTTRGPAAAIPFTEYFDAGALTNLSDAWTFETTETGVISLVDDPGAPGNATLRFAQSNYGSESAILTVDLTGQTNVTLDFRVQQTAPYNSLGSAAVLVSRDGTNWQAVKELGWTPVGVWRHVSVALDPVVQTQGVGYGSRFQIKFHYAAPYYGRANVWLWDDIRVTRGVDVFGPAVTDLFPKEETTGPLAAFRMAFNEPVNPASFPTSAVTVLNPAGVAVEVTAVVPDPDARAYTLHFIMPQTMPGVYRVASGRHVADFAGNWLDQDLDGISDPFSGTLRIGSGQAAFPALEDFQGGITNPGPGWRFETIDQGRIAIVGDPAAPGKLALQFSQPEYGSESAILTVDLTGQTNVTLDFRAQQAALYNALGSAEVSVSQDGTNWHTVSTLGWTPVGIWRHVSVALDPVIQTHGLGYGAGFQIKFQYTAGRYSRGNVWLWDDIRVTRDVDVSGPTVTDLFPKEETTGALAAFRMAFNEPINPASFPTSAVMVLNPAGVAVEVTAVVPDPDARAYTLHFIMPQTMPGVYRVALDRDVADLAGNWLDQDLDGISDPFSGTLRIASGQAAFPALEDFQGGITNPGPGWRFETADQGRIAIVGDPAAPGNLVLRFSQADYGSETAILIIDLTGRTNVVLDFRAQQAALYNALGSAEVSVSQDGTNWHTVTTLGWTPVGIWRHVSVALDPVIQARGLGYGAGFQIKFHYAAGYYGRGSVWLWDDVLVSSLGIAQRTLNIRRTAGAAELSFNPDPAFDYAVEYRDSMSPTASWRLLPGAPHNRGFILETGEQTERYYRLKIDLRRTPGGVAQ